jgi:hypothetical protein
MNCPQQLVILSRVLLESKGYILDRMDERWPLPNDLIAVDIANNTVYVVFVTTVKQAFSLWMQLLGDERIRNLLSHTEPPMIACLVHKWSMRSDGRPMCEVSEITSEDFEEVDHERLNERAIRSPSKRI